jgi:predicted phage tail protein
VVAFTTSLENGIIVRPGAIIEIADPVKAGVRRAGRLSSATTTVLTVDSDVDLPTSGTVSVVLPDGIVENRTIQQRCRHCNNSHRSIHHSTAKLAQCG